MALNMLCLLEMALLPTMFKLKLCDSFLTGVELNLQDREHWEEHGSRKELHYKWRELKSDFKLPGTILYVVIPQNEFPRVHRRQFFTSRCEASHERNQTIANIGLLKNNIKVSLSN